jgi:hypothetical protein
MLRRLAYCLHESDTTLADINIALLAGRVNFRTCISEARKAGRLPSVPQVAQPAAALRRAAVLVAIQEVLENLPQKYSNDDYRVKCESVYPHVSDSYYGAGLSVYGVAGKVLFASF